MKQHFDGQLQDVSEAGMVEITIKGDNSVIWVNIDGVCVLRICKIKQGIMVKGSRKPQVFVNPENN